jgi:DNA-binding XRE family transcriptional regulator
LGVCLETVINWEKGRTEPPTTSAPALIAFLGYNPYPPPTTLPERLLALRRTRGWTLTQAADALGLDEGTWGQWERGEPIAWQRYRDQVEAFLIGRA